MTLAGCHIPMTRMCARYFETGALKRKRLWQGAKRLGYAQTKKKNQKKKKKKKKKTITQWVKATWKQDR